MAGSAGRLEPALSVAPHGIASLTDLDAAEHLTAFATIVEHEGLTVIAEVPALDAAGIAHEGPFALVSLGLDSALDGIGLTAAFSTALAQQGISCNVLAGYHHDHMLVPWDRREDAIATLSNLEFP